MAEHYAAFLQIFLNMEKAVYQNSYLIDFIADINNAFY